MSTFLPYTDEHHALRETARRFIESEVQPHYAQWEKDGQLPKALYRKAGELGLLLTTIPEEYGGGCGDFLFAHIVNEELGFAGATGPQFGLHSDIVAPYILHNGSEEQSAPGCRAWPRARPSPAAIWPACRPVRAATATTT